MRPDELTEVDPEVAAATLRRDLDALWDSGRPEALGWIRLRLNDLTWVIEIPARTEAGEVFSHYVRLDGTHYRTHPVRVTFVHPDGETRAQQGTRWWPVIVPGEPVNRWFGLHDNYQYEDGSQGQLVCFSMNLDYYTSAHTPQPGQGWDPARHTVSATLSRLAEVLISPHYKGPGALGEDEIKDAA